MTAEEYIKKMKRKMPPFVNKEGLPSWLENAYNAGFDEAFNKALEWLGNNVDGWIDMNYDQKAFIEKFKEDIA